MTQEKIIEMARQAGARPSSNPDEYDVLKITTHDLEAFAKLIEEKVKQENAGAAATLDEMRRRYDDHFAKALGRK